MPDTPHPDHAAIAAADPRLVKQLEAWVRHRNDALAVAGETNLLAVSLGERQRGDAGTGELALIHHVAEKRPPDGLPTGAVAVPSHIRFGSIEVPTDVRALRLPAQDATAAPVVVRPETAIGDHLGSRGTVGALAWHRPTGQAVALSARHVLGMLGDSAPVYHPARGDGGTPLGAIVAELFNRHGDAAVCAMDRRLANPAGLVSGIAITAVVQPQPGMAVMLFGAQSRGSCGIIERVDRFTLGAQGRHAALTMDGIVIKPDPRRPQAARLSQPADSGGCWLVADGNGQPTGQLVGLHAGGDATGTVAFASRADVVFEQLQLGLLARPTIAPLDRQIATRDAAIMRGLPGSDSNRLLTLPRGTPLAVVAQHGDWAAVDLHGDGAIDGFVHSALIAATGDANRA